MKKIDLKYKNLSIPLLYEFDNSMPVVNFKLIFKASGSVANGKFPGLANLVAKMLNEGTSKLGVSEFANLLELKAVNLSIFSGFETFGFEINTLKENFDYGLNLLISLLKDPNFTQKTLDKIKTLIKGEIASNNTDFDYLSRTELNRLLYENTSLEYPQIGTLESIDKIGLNEVKEFFDALFLENLFIVLAGDIKENINLNELLNCFKNGNKNNLAFIKTSDEKKLSFVKKQVEQAYIYFGAPYNVKKDEIFKANVAIFIFGSSGFGSRLMEEIRVKRGLAYSIYARADFGLSSSKIWGYMQTKNESKDDAINVIKSEFLKFVKDGVSQDELNSAKNFLLGSVVLQKETMFGRININQKEFYMGEEFGEFERTLEKIKALNLDDLNKFIKAHDEILNLSFSVVSGS
ncbi:M16 family metallopeptidase [Campylobacter ureolyticus]|uniref:Pitrilysin family protein n=1 Tax=Campylobacter ureolyticus TaxID=827 RepID=A0A9Q4KKI2_9BACT|nr:pitrilysin family protein [Campylobacter ureolyticus]MCZ6102986.1 pitrilysin family protein [Campylobacter ureolyticus]MCZ6161298.1 pitrilysin family protein [Campylobacter ureolyticus]MCZ6170418.1 pitrilysin family protein [Campylobacter ureolyticus]MCZ6174428.1 pitrilysin family protein [Campylobacter ureolyticus]MCZ6185596.1 pitrilysin family protein [Campylobacter ureolyticus]